MKCLLISLQSNAYVTGLKYISANLLANGHDAKILLLPGYLEKKLAPAIEDFIQSLKKDDVTWENYNEPESLLKIATKIIDDFPEILEESSNIASEDLQELPIEVIVQILDKVIEVNMAAKDSLVGNFTSLMGRFTKMIPGSKTKESLEPSKN